VSNKTSPASALLHSLSAADIAQLQLQPVDLPHRKHLERAGRRTEQAYFIDRGIASVLATGAAGPHIEIGMIGREGVTGLTAIMGAQLSPYDTFMQIPGAGWQAPIEAVAAALDTNVVFRKRILDYAQAFLAHVSATAAVNAHNKLVERLARWLLVSRDRTDTDDLSLTHDFIAQMLGVRRAGVTVALQELEERGLIKAGRGQVRILDRDGLRARTNGAYTPADEAMRLRAS
jgi:CRP-like cAMP-binding protein